MSPAAEEFVRAVRARLAAERAMDDASRRCREALARLSGDEMDAVRKLLAGERSA